MRNSEEIWQVEVNGQIYETTFGELPTWIADDALVETDKVRRGNLRWLEAGRVPSLVPFFNAKANGEPLPGIAVSTTVAEEPAADEPAAAPSVYGTWSNDAASSPEPSNDPQPDLSAQETVPDLPAPQFCSIHPGVPSRYICTACHHPFCGECPEGFGASVRLCPYCGAMCGDVEKQVEENRFEARVRADIDHGFGFDDFGRAIAYPFRFKTSLFFGGLLFAFFSLGQGAASLGSIFLAAGAIICFMMANALTFGVLANTVENFSKGVIEKNFMPSFDDFSLWDDVVHPFFLSIAVYISSFGLLIALIVGAVWYSWNSFAGSLAPKTDPAQAMLADDSGPTPKHIKELLENARKQNEARSDPNIGEDGLTELQRKSIQEEKDFQKLNDFAGNYQKQQLESVVGPSPGTRDENFRTMAGNFLKFAGVFLFLAGVALLWGLFYFPAACAVAGYTRSFTATLNPLVGLDTMRRLGLDYVKILLMVLGISVISAVVASVLGIIFAPFDLPMFGNLPAKFIGSFATFYFSVVLAVVLGFALYRNSEKLALYKG
jgi:hypothetical protein